MEEMSFQGFSIFSSGGHFVQTRGTILLTLVKGHKKNTSVKLLKIRSLAAKEILLRDFFFFYF